MPMTGADISTWLQPFKELVVFQNAVQYWEEDWYPVASLILIPTIYEIIKYTNPSLLTLVAMKILIGMAASTLIKIMQDEWTPAEEERFNSICERIALIYNSLAKYLDEIIAFEADHPSVFKWINAGCLLILAYVGTQVSDLTIWYVVCLSMYILPGFVARGLHTKFTTMAMDTKNKLTDYALVLIERELIKKYLSKEYMAQLFDQSLEQFMDLMTKASSTINLSPDLFKHLTNKAMDLVETARGVFEGLVGNENSNIKADSTNAHPAENNDASDSFNAPQTTASESSDSFNADWNPERMPDNSFTD